MRCGVTYYSKMVNNLDAEGLRTSLDFMVEYYLSLMEGATHRIGDAYKLMKALGYVDEDGFPIYTNEDMV